MHTDELYQKGTNVAGQLTCDVESSASPLEFEVSNVSANSDWTVSDDVVVFSDSARVVESHGTYRSRPIASRDEFDVVVDKRLASQLLSWEIEMLLMAE